MARRSMTATKDPVTIDTFVGGLGDRQLHCRRLGHTWHPQNVTRDDAGFVEVLRCSSCHTGAWTR